MIRCLDRLLRTGRCGSMPVFGYIENTLVHGRIVSVLDLNRRTDCTDSLMRLTKRTSLSSIMRAQRKSELTPSGTRCYDWWTIAPDSRIDRRLSLEWIWTSCKEWFSRSFSTDFCIPPDDLTI